MKKFLSLLLLASIGTSCCDITNRTTAEEEINNVIYMIGDGMGLAHTSMLKIEGEYAPTAFDRAHNIALITTHSTNNRVTDSAAAGTALATGHKTRNRMVGMTPDSVAVESMMLKAEREGYATGLTYTCYLQHATPASFYASSPHRDSMNIITGCFVKSGIDVALGGGRQFVEEYYTLQGKDYKAELASLGYQVLHNPEEMTSVSSGNVLGLFAEDNMPKIREGRGDYLLQATNKALEVLTNNVANDNKRGFLLMVEGSKIDYRSHDNDSEGILAEMRDFEKCVAAAMDYADTHPGTLVIICADHETGGLSIPSQSPDFKKADSGINYRYTTKGHSGTMVPVYLYGTGAERINGVMDNTDLAKQIMAIMDWE